MTVDAVGGIWRYAVDLAAALHDAGLDTVFAGFGPEPSAAQREEAEAAHVTLHWCDGPLDWVVKGAADLAAVPGQIRDLAREQRVDLVQVNMPAQAARLVLPVPVVAVSHSCVATWFAAVKGGPLPLDWAWHARMTRDGLCGADAIVAPSQAQATLLRRCYGELPEIQVIHNASGLPASRQAQPASPPYFFASGRWWDAGKNGAVLDAAAPSIVWPVVMAGATSAPDGQSISLSHARTCGSLDHRAALGLAAGASGFVAPSLYEPFGLAVLEAASLGLPLILSDIPTFRELWEDAALFFAPDDPAALAAIANRLAADAPLRADLADRAKARAARYASQAQSMQMLALYRQLWAFPEARARRPAVSRSSSPLSTR